MLEGREDEDGSFPQTRFGLAENIGTEDGLRDADLLDYVKVKRRMLESIREGMREEKTSIEQVCASVHLRREGP